MIVPDDLPSRLRCAVVLTAIDDVDPLEWETAITESCAELHKEFPEASITGLISIDLDDLVKSSLAYRPLGIGYDAAIEIAIDRIENPEKFLAVAPILENVINPIVNPSASISNVGIAHYAVIGGGSYALTQIGFRADNISEEEFVQWWTGHHNRFNIEASGDAMITGYSMQHRIDPITSQLNNMLGYADAEHIYDPVYFDDIEIWRATVSPEVAAAALADERGHFGHSIMRAKMQKVVAQL